LSDLPLHLHKLFFSGGVQLFGELGGGPRRRKASSFTFKINKNNKNNKNNNNYNYNYNYLLIINN
jgi:hypothetical protein